MKNGITEFVFILDKSGSMSGLEGDTIGGFNAMIEDQKKQEGKVYVSTILFSSYSKVLHDRLPLEKVEPLTEKDYRVGGCTALFDAIGGAVKHIANVHKYAREEDVPEHTLFVITTDGYENASRQFNKEGVKKLIKQQEEKGWEFLFVAANIDAAEVGEEIGFRKERVANYDAREGTGVLYEQIAETSRQFRIDGRIFDNWSEEIEKTTKRKKDNGRKDG